MLINSLWNHEGRHNGKTVLLISKYVWRSFIFRWHAKSAFYNRKIHFCLIYLFSQKVSLFDHLWNFDIGKWFFHMTLQMHISFPTIYDQLEKALLCLNRIILHLKCSYLLLINNVWIVRYITAFVDGNISYSMKGKWIIHEWPCDKGWWDPYGAVSGLLVGSPSPATVIERNEPWSWHISSLPRDGLHSPRTHMHTLMDTHTLAYFLYIIYTDSASLEV